MIEEITKAWTNYLLRAVQGCSPGPSLEWNVIYTCKSTTEQGTIVVPRDLTANDVYSAIKEEMELENEITQHLNSSNKWCRMYNLKGNTNTQIKIELERM